MVVGGGREEEGEGCLKGGRSKWCGSGNWRGDAGLEHT